MNAEKRSSWPTSATAVASGEGDAEAGMPSRRLDMERFERKLREREAQLLAELRSGQQDAEREPFSQIASEAPDSGDSALADVVTDTRNADRERDANELRDVREALGRIEAGTYGICQQCGEPIDEERLDAFPTAKYDLVHQEERERRGDARPTPSL